MAPVVDYQRLLEFAAAENWASCCLSYDLEPSLLGVSFVAGCGDDKF
jgi:hypothetical protein